MFSKLFSSVRPSRVVRRDGAVRWGVNRLFKKVLKGFKGVKGNNVRGFLCVFVVFHGFSLGRVVLYIVFIVFSLPKTLVKTLAKSIQKPGPKSGKKPCQNSDKSDENPRGKSLTGLFPISLGINTNKS